MAQPVVIQALIHALCLCAVALPALGGQYPVFSAAPAAKLMEEGKVHTVEHLINPLAMQHPEHTNATAAAAAAAATVLPAVSTPPPFQVCQCLNYSCSLTHSVGCSGLHVIYSIHLDLTSSLPTFFHCNWFDFICV